MLQLVNFWHWWKKKYFLTLYNFFAMNIFLEMKGNQTRACNENCHISVV